MSEDSSSGDSSSEEVYTENQDRLSEFDYDPDLKEEVTNAERSYWRAFYAWKQEKEALMPVQRRAEAVEERYKLQGAIGYYDQILRDQVEKAYHEDLGSSDDERIAYVFEMDEARRKLRESKQRLREVTEVIGLYDALEKAVWRENVFPPKGKNEQNYELRGFRSGFPRKLREWIRVLKTKTEEWNRRSERLRESRERLLARARELQKEDQQRAARIAEINGSMRKRLPPQEKEQLKLERRTLKKAIGRELEALRDEFPRLDEFLEGREQPSKRMRDCIGCGAPAIRYAIAGTPFGVCSVKCAQ